MKRSKIETHVDILPIFAQKRAQKRSYKIHQTKLRYTWTILRY